MRFAPSRPTPRSPRRWPRIGRVVLLFCSIVVVAYPASAQADTPERLRLATFDLDATPPVGSMMAYDVCREHGEIGLRCRGVVLMGDGSPVVLCAIDWIGIGNEGYARFRQVLAKAAETTPQRVAVHCLHQHDAPRCDFSAEQLLLQSGVQDRSLHDGAFARMLLERLGETVAQAVQSPTAITHVGFGAAEVHKVASNRRILGDDGKVRAVRYTTCRDPKLRAEPEGTIDPELSCVSFWDGESPVAVLSYYACHPQSYYRTGIPSPDFPGLARFLRSQDAPGPLYVHFNGAGGNIGAGKYNDGDKENRMILARRVAAGMQAAFEATERVEIGAGDLAWNVDAVALPPAKHLDADKLRLQLAQFQPGQYWSSADKLAWLLRCQAGDKIDIGCLSLGPVRVLHLPGELFVEYQLAAKRMRPDLKVAMAAYGDYGPGYIGTEVAYDEGGYETSRPASNTAPEVEGVLLGAMERLLEVQP